MFTTHTSDKNEIFTRLPCFIEFITASCIPMHTKSSNNITQIFICNYTPNGSQNLKIQNLSHSKCIILNHNILNRMAFLGDLTQLEYISFARNAFKHPFRISTFKVNLCIDSLKSLILIL